MSDSASVPVPAPEARADAAAQRLRPPFTALAGVYDAIMQDVPYDEWCDFVLREATARGFSGGRILEVGCGTGNATRPMCDRGFDVVAIDVSEQMAAHARRKCPEADVRVADVRDFRLDRSVSLAFAVFDTLNNLLDDDGLLAALRCVHDALEPGGLFVFDANTREGLRALWEGGVAEGWVDGVAYRWTHTWDEARSLATVDAHCRTAEGWFVERHVERPLDPDVVRAGLLRAGFATVDILAWPSGGSAPPDAPRVWVIARAGT